MLWLPGEIGPANTSNDLALYRLSAVSSVRANTCVPSSAYTSLIRRNDAPISLLWAITAWAPTPPPIICSLSIWTRALSCHARSLSAWVFCSSRRIRTAVGMSSGLTADRSGGGVGGAALPAPATVPSALVPAGAPDGAALASAGAPAFAAGVLAVGLSLGL